MLTLQFVRPPLWHLHESAPRHFQRIPQLQGNRHPRSLHNTIQLQVPLGSIDRALLFQEHWKEKELDCAIPINWKHHSLLSLSKCFRLTFKERGRLSGYPVDGQHFLYHLLGYCSRRVGPRDPAPI